MIEVNMFMNVKFMLINVRYTEHYVPSYSLYYSFSDKIITNSLFSESWVWTGYAYLKYVYSVSLRYDCPISMQDGLYRILI